MSVLSVVNARKSFGAVQALDGASLVLLTLTLVFLGLARLLARRWETA